VANLVAIPAVTLLITPLALAGALLGALWPVSALLVQALVAGLAALADWPAAVWTAAAAPPWGVAAGLLGALLLVLPLPWRLRALGLPLMLPLLAPAVARPPPGQFELVAADVGQGTAVLLRTRRHLLVFDAGPQYSRDSDAGQRVLLPLLRARGEDRITGLVLSHRDSDHVGGAAALQAALPVDGLRHSLPEGHALLATPTPAQRCQDGQRWQWDGVAFEVLHPLADSAMPARPNALSCVLQVTDSGGRSALLTADIEAAQEAALVARHGPRLRSEVLMVPHHGSRTSSSATLLDMVQPRTAFVQAGYRSRFGHPASDVLARYRERGITLVRSDRCGAWTWRAGAARCERQHRPRYWRWVPPADDAPATPAPGADVAKPLAAGETKR
jgi:competence protein ComEC